MAFPKLLQKLFQNNGAGDKLNQDIIPDIPYSKVTDAPSVDSALSSTSENPVQNKVINSALDGKLSTSGGTVSGSTIISQVSFPGSGNIRTTSTDTELILNYEQGAWLSLLGKDFPREDKGAFIITANGGKILKGSPDGTLRWCGKNVLTGNSAGLTVVAESYSANSWYRKYSDGWIEQGGLFTARADWRDGSRNVALPIAFSSACYSVVALHAEERSTGYTSDDAAQQYTTTIRVSNVTKTNVVFTWSTSGGGSSEYASVSLTASLYMCGK